MKNKLPLYATLFLAGLTLGILISIIDFSKTKDINLAPPSVRQDYQAAAGICNEGSIFRCFDNCAEICDPEVPNPSQGFIQCWLMCICSSESAYCGAVQGCASVQELCELVP